MYDNNVVFITPSGVARMWIIWIFYYYDFQCQFVICGILKMLLFLILMKKIQNTEFYIISVKVFSIKVWKYCTSSGYEELAELPIVAVHIAILVPNIYF